MVFTSSNIPTKDSDFCKAFPKPIILKRIRRDVQGILTFIENNLNIFLKVIMPSLLEASKRHLDTDYEILITKLVKVVFK